MIIEYYKKFDQELTDVKKHLDYLDYIDPVNYNEEKKKFDNYLSSGKFYNPQYRYNIPDKDSWGQIINKLESLKKNIPDKLSILKKIYEYDINNCLERVSYIREIGDNITVQAKKVFGGLDPILFEEALNRVVYSGDLLPKSDDEFLSEHELRSESQKILTDIGADDGWQIAVRKHNSIATVYPFRKEVVFDKRLQYEKIFLETLLSHELKGHVKQIVQAEKEFGLDIFKFGFGYFEPFNEGVALLEERKVNSMVFNRIYLYYIATYFANKHSFYDTYNHLLNWLNSDNSFLLTYRVKRGLSDTSLPGSNMKEKIYLEGLNLLDNCNLETLEIAKKCNFDYSFVEEVKYIYKIFNN